MPRIDFERLPDDARLWVFAASRTLTDDERDAFLTEVDRFLDGWAAHGVPLSCARDFRYDQFLLVAVDERGAGASGCSIDALTRVIQDLERRAAITMLDHGPVWYRTDQGVARVSRADFGALADAGSVGPETTVFDNTITTVGAVRAGQWETAAQHTWHGRAFLGVPPPPLSPR